MPIAYSRASAELKEKKEQFIDGLEDRDMILRVQQTRRIDLNDFVRHAVELYAFQATDNRMNDSQTYAKSTQSDEKKIDPISI